MKNNLLFLYGEDSYSSRRKLAAIKAKYIDASLGDTNLSVIDGEKTSIDELVRQIYALPFLAKSRLIVINDLLTAGKAAIQEKVFEILPRVPATTIALFYERETPDRRGKLYKTLTKIAKSQYFALLQPPQLEPWISNYVVSQGALIDKDALNELAQSIGPDLWRLHNELDKLILYSQTITIDMVRTLVDSPINANIFDLLDALGQRTADPAFQALKRLTQAGEESLKTLAMVVKTIRMITVDKKENALPPHWRVHPYVAQKTHAQSRNFSAQDLKIFYRKLATIDYLAKTGTMEAETALALFVAQATKS